MSRAELERERCKVGKWSYFQRCQVHTCAEIIKVALWSQGHYWPLYKTDVLNATINIYWTISVLDFGANDHLPPYEPKAG